MDNGFEKKLLNRIKNNNPQKNNYFNEGILSSLISKKSDSYELIKCENEEAFEQGKTGYCWLISTLFCISKYIEKKNNIIIRFSKNYLMFYDKLEKANKFLTYMIKYITLPISDQRLSYLLNNAMTDKGQWSMAENIIEKYGIVPYDAMPELNPTISTNKLNACLSYLLKCCVAKIRKNYYRNGKNYAFLKNEKEKAMIKVYELLVDFYGTPPQKVNLPKCFLDNQRVISPMEFYSSYINFPFDDYISICNMGKENYINYSIEIDGNEINGKPNTFLSIPESCFDLAVKNQSKEEHFCWFACDAGKFYIKKGAIFDDSLFDIKKIVGDDDFKKMSRNQIYSFGIAKLTHAMVFCNIFEKNNKTYFIAKNSAYQNSNGGYCYVSNSWFKKYVFQAVVNKKYLNINSEYKTKKVMPWNFFT